MKKTLLFLSVSFGLGLALVAQANFGSMMDFRDGCGMMGGGGFWGTSLVGLVYFALASFIFSVIFWWVNKWINKK